jgi:hypothetical protein
MRALAEEANKGARAFCSLWLACCQPFQRLRIVSVNSSRVFDPFAIRRHAG